MQLVLWPKRGCQNKQYNYRAGGTRSPIDFTEGKAQTQQKNVFSLDMFWCTILDMSVHHVIVNTANTSLLSYCFILPAKFNT